MCWGGTVSGDRGRLKGLFFATCPGRGVAVEGYGRSVARVRAVLLPVVLTAVACTAGDAAPEETSVLATSTSTTAVPVSSTSTTTRPTPGPTHVVDVPDAVTVNVAGNGVDDPVVAWISEDGVFVATLDPESGRLGDPVAVHGDQPPFAHPIERPAVAVASGGVVHVAYVSIAGPVVHGTWDGTTLTGPTPISGVPRPETVLVHMTLDGDHPVLSWLEDSTLSVATTREGAIVEHESVDDLTCDCCHPVPLVLSQATVVAYRDQIRDGGDVIRDVRVVRSDDGGTSFGEPVLVPDDHWYIDACPFTGPSVVGWEDHLVIAWMDARQSRHPEQRSTTIWVDSSTDGGRSFGTDVPVSGDRIHRWPVLARDRDGVIHLVWESQGDGGGLSYSRSSDEGRSFASPLVLVSNAEAGSPSSPSTASHDDVLVVSWTDREGGHVAVFEPDGLSG